MNANQVIQALNNAADPVRAEHSVRFFKTGPGQYGEGDKFIGATLPQQRLVAKQFQDLPLLEIKKLLHSPIHEHRLTALIILVNRYKRSDDSTKEVVADLYYKNRTQVNSWDLVDSSAPYILGEHTLAHPSDILAQLAASKSLWDRRIAIIATFAWLRKGDCTQTLKLAKLLLGDKEDLIHKAVGWALREVGKKDIAALRKFLDKHAATMPRTALRYAIERFDADERRSYLGLRQKP